MKGTKTRCQGFLFFKYELNCDFGQDVFFLNQTIFLKKKHHDKLAGRRRV